MSNFNYLNEWEEMHDEAISMEPVKTIRGVYKNLEQSPFFVIINGRTLRFSSKAKLQKFKTKLCIFKNMYFRTIIKILGREPSLKEEAKFQLEFDDLVLIYYNEMLLK